MHDPAYSCSLGTASPRRPRVYLAGPDVFFPDVAERSARLKEICAHNGLEGVFPLDAGPALGGLEPNARGNAIFFANLRLIRSCSAMAANLSPFRGPSVDPGTAFEVGFGRCREIHLAGYSTDLSEYRTRVAEDGLLIEDFGMVDNLMIDAAVEGRIYATAEEAIEALRILLGVPA